MRKLERDVKKEELKCAETRKGREMIITRKENEDGECYRSRRDAVAPRARWGIEQAGGRKEGSAYFAWRTRSTSWRTHEERERERAIRAQQGRWRPCATSESRVTRG